jgi:hypothetical protein
MRKSELYNSLWYYSAELVPGLIKGPRPPQKKKNAPIRNGWARWALYKHSCGRLRSGYRGTFQLRQCADFHSHASGLGGTLHHFTRCGSSQLDPRELVDGFDGLAVACKRWGPRQAHHSRRAPGSEPRTLAALLLESIALRHQITVLERSRTRRPCFRLRDRLFWILFSRWWPQ